MISLVSGFPPVALGLQGGFLRFGIVIGAGRTLPHHAAVLRLRPHVLLTRASAPGAVVGQVAAPPFACFARVAGLGRKSCVIHQNMQNAGIFAGISISA